MNPLSSFGLLRDPFDTVPPHAPTSAWAGRPSVKKQLIQLSKSWEFQEGPTAHLIWADVGAGKTHALRFLQHLASKPDVGIRALYCDFPNEVKNFGDVTRQLLSQCDERELRESIFQHRSKFPETWLSGAHHHADPDTLNTLWILSQIPVGQQGDTARKWLKCERLGSRELRDLGNPSQSDSGDKATKILLTCAWLLLEYGICKRLAFFLDEYQRISTRSKTVINGVSDGLQRVFDSSLRVSFVLCYSFGDRKDIVFLLSKALLSRVQTEYHLPYLSRSEAMEFIGARIETDSVGNKNALYTADAIGYLIDRAEPSAKGQFTPRNVMMPCKIALQRGRDSDKTYRGPLSKPDVARLLTGDT